MPCIGCKSPLEHVSRSEAECRNADCELRGRFQRCTYCLSLSVGQDAGCCLEPSCPAQGLRRVACPACEKLSLTTLSGGTERCLNAKCPTATGDVRVCPSCGGERFFHTPDTMFCTKGRRQCPEVFRTKRACGECGRLTFDVARGRCADIACGSVRSRDIQVVPTATAAGPAVDASTRHAVLVGVSRFGEGVSPLQHAEADARALRDVLVDPACGAYEPGNVRLLLGEQSTRDQVMQALGSFLRRSVSDQDLVLVYFATHGVVWEDEGYLLLSDSDPQNPFGSALRMGELAHWLKRLTSKQVVVILDACHAGAVTPADSWGRTLRGFGDDLAGRVVLAACGPGEQSLELDADGQGLFTKHLLHGLRGEADTNADGVVDALELFAYTREHVQQEASGLARRQQPTWWGEVSDRMALSQNLLAAQGPRPHVIRRLRTPRLLLLDDVGPRVRFRLTARKTTIGRHPDCDIQVLGDRRVGRSHGWVERTARGWRYGCEHPERTRRNGAPLESRETMLQDRDELLLGDTRLLFLSGGDEGLDLREAGEASLI